MLQVISFGDCALVGIPAELFVEFGLDIKRKSIYKHTFIVELANDWVGYVPTKQAFRYGGYQTWDAWSSKFAPDAGKLIVDRSLNLLNKINKRQNEIRRGNT